MLRRIVPKGTVLRKVYTETHYGNGTYARQVGSYPLLIYIPARLELGRWIDVVVSEHGFRSVIGVPYPVSVNEAPKRLLKYVPSMSRDVLNRIIASRPIRSYEQLKSIIGSNQELSRYLVL